MDFYLEKHGILDLFSTDIRPYLELHKFKRGEPITITGEPIKYFYFQVDGRSKIYKILMNGKSLLMKFFTPLEVIGEIEMIENIGANSNIDAVTDCLMLAVEMPKMKEITNSDLAFLRFLNKHLVAKLMGFSVNSTINQLYPRLLTGIYHVESRHVYTTGKIGNTMLLQKSFDFLSCRFPFPNHVLRLLGISLIYLVLVRGFQYHPILKPGH